MKRGNTSGSVLLKAFPRRDKSDKRFDAITARIQQQGNVSPYTGMRIEQPIQPVLTLDGGLTSFIPGVGDAAVLASTANDVSQGNYSSAFALPVAMILGPKVGKAVAAGARKLGNAAQNAYRVVRNYENFSKSRKTYTAAEKVYDNLAKNGNKLAAMRYMYPDYNPGDITHMYLFKDEFKTKEDFAKAMREIESQIQVPGRKTSPVMDWDLSTDSAPLLFHRMAKNASKGRGTVGVVKDGTATRMVKLNEAGNRMDLDYTNRTLQELREASGLKIPDAISLGGSNYIPAMYYTHIKKFGGLLRPYPILRRYR